MKDNFVDNFPEIKISLKKAAAYLNTSPEAIMPIDIANEITGIDLQNGMTCSICCNIGNSDHSTLQHLKMMQAAEEELAVEFDEAEVKSILADHQKDSISDWVDALEQERAQNPELENEPQRVAGGCGMCPGPHGTGDHIRWLAKTESTENTSALERPKWAIAILEEIGIEINDQDVDISKLYQSQNL